ncbi:MAG: hypothetical protein FJX76_07950 [Armatimonadetes bacterium]|nr:hypothetical protein [Armatimonadota bacterium]
MPRLKTAIERWNRLLENDALLRETRDQFMAGVRAHGLVYGDRVISTVLRPRFVGEATWKQAAEVGASFHRALARLQRLLRQDAGMLKALGIRGRLAELVGMPQRGADDLWFTRLDGFVDRGVLRLVEFNVDSPGGAAFVDAMARVFAGLEVFRRFTRDVGLSRRPSIPWIRRCVARLAPARVAIIDWREVATRREFQLIAEDLRGHGFDTVIADPRDVEIKRGRAVVEGKPVDVVLKRVLVTDLEQRYDEVKTFLRAIREGLIYCLNPPACQAVTTKSLLALFHEGMLAAHLTRAQHEAWRRHVPWTARVREGRVPWRGRSVDLISLAVSRRERLVLKPSDAYGAEGIVLGWRCSQSEWENALCDALKSEFVVQERVAIPLEEFPDADEGTLRLRPMHTELSPYTFHPQSTAECLSRLSASDFLNVKTGGGVVPTYVLRDAR